VDPLTTWFWTARTAEGLPMVCLDARHAKKAFDMKVNKNPLLWREVERLAQRIFSMVERPSYQ
jgi:hypothetical protein